MMIKKIAITCLVFVSLAFSASSDTILGQYLSASFDFKFQKNDKQSNWDKKEKSLSQLSSLNEEERIDFYIKAFNYADIDGESFEEFIQTIICHGDLKPLKRKLESLIQKNKGFLDFSKKNNLLLDVLTTSKDECPNKKNVD
ncbi:MAG: hypothetical protein J5534_12795 [Fibrobacter sp.]|nr:hypothetical protein [Fibrobacter sp.]